MPDTATDKLHSITPDIPSDLQPQNAASQQIESQDKAQEKQTDDLRITPRHERVGRFVHRNQSLVNGNPVGYTGYQFLRSAAACVPYGITGAAVFQGTEAIKNATAAGAEAKKVIPSVLHSVTNRAGPLGALSIAAQIGASFTLYRTVSFTGRNMYDRLFDKRNTEEDTIREVAKAPGHLWNDFKLNLNTQKVAVPWAALTLGFIVSKAPNVSEYLAGKPSQPGKWNWTKAITENGFKSLNTGGAETWKTAGVATIAYGTFFEVANLLGKQYRKDKGLTEAVTPEKPHPGLERAPEDKSYGFFTNEGSLGRLAFRHMIPVALGVGAYLPAKRLGYFAAGKMMKAEKPAWGLLGTEGSLTKNFWQNSWLEGAATTLFFLYPLAKDPIQARYDDFFESLEQRVDIRRGETKYINHALAQSVDQQIADKEIAEKKAKEIAGTKAAPANDQQPDHHIDGIVAEAKGTVAHPPQQAVNA